MHWRPDVFRQLFPATGFAHLCIPLGLLGFKEEHLQQLEKNFLALAQRMLTNIWFKLRKMETTFTILKWFQAKIYEKHFISAISVFQLNKLTLPFYT